MINRTFPLENFEIYVHRDILQVAQHIHSSAGVTGVQQKDQLRIVTIQDSDSKLEVEIEIVRRKIKNYSCDCRGEDAGLCEHIAAGLIHLKEEQVKKDLKRKKKQNAPKKTLTIRNLLTEVSDQELREFVTKYLSIDAKFALALKTRFAHRVRLTGQHNHQKYYHLLRNFWKIHRSGPKKRSENEMLKYLRETLALAGDLMAQNEIKEVFSILFGLLKFVMMWPVEQEERVQEFERELIEYFTAFFAKNYSPTLKSSHLEEIGELVRELEYQPLSTHHTIYHLMAQHGDSRQRNSTLQLLKEHYLSSKNPDMFFTWISTVVSVGGLEAVRQIYGPHVKQLRYVRVLLAACGGFLTDIDLALLAREVYENSTNLSIKNYIYQFVITLNLPRDQYGEWLRLHFEATSDFEVLVLIKKHDIKKWPEYLQSVRQKWKAAEDQMNVARSYELEDDFDALLTMLSEVHDLDTIVNCMGLLPRSHHDEALELLYDRFVIYLASHVGYPSVVYVSKSLQRLVSQGKGRLAQSLEELLIENFTDRKLLRRELHYS